MTIPVVLSTTPSNGASGVTVGSYITIQYNTALNPSSVTTTNILVVKRTASFTYVSVPGTVSYDSVNKVISFVPTLTMSYSSTYKVIVKGDNSYNDLFVTGIKSINDEAMVGDYEFTFTTESQPLPVDDDDEEEDDTDDTGLPTVKFDVLSTIPENRTIFYTGITMNILFNDSLNIPDSGETPYHVQLTSESEVLHNYIVVYRSNILGTESSYAITESEQIDFDYSIDQDVLTISLVDSGTLTLPYNSQYRVTLSPGMSGIATLPCDHVHQYTFTSVLVPMYTTPYQVRMNLGGIIDNLTDEFIYKLIHRYSIEIYNIYLEGGYTLPFFPTDSGVVPSEVRQWVLCSTKLNLLRQIMNAAAVNGGQIQLGDFAMTVGDLTKNLGSELNDLQNCVNVTAQRIQDFIYPRMQIAIPHLLDTRAPWHLRDGKYRHTLKGDDDAPRFQRFPW